MRKQGRPRVNEDVTPSKGLATRVPLEVYYGIKVLADKRCERMSVFLRRVLRGALPDLDWDPLEEGRADARNARDD